MADAPSSRFTYKRRGAKPYDVSHSFVQRVTSSVTQLLPQPAWLSQWFSQSEHGASGHGSTVVRQAAEASPENLQPAGPPEISEDEDSSEEEEEPVVKSRPRIPVNKPFPPDSFRIHRLNDVNAEADGCEAQDNGRHNAAPSSKARPSAFEWQRKFVSSTPAVGSQSVPESSTKRLDTTYSSPILPVRTARSERATEELLSQSTQTRSLAHGNVEEKLNGGDDQSITSDSTSVCSSLPARPSTYKLGSIAPGSKKRRIVEEDVEDDHLEDVRRSDGPRSLNLERKRARLVQSFNCSSASQLEATLGSRNPSFNVDVYASRKVSDSRASSLSSSFYAGETTYGGASAYDRRKSLLHHSSSPTCFPRLGAVEVRPKADSPRVIDTGVSRTAWRILDTLQQLSTPVREAKGIPLPTRQPQSPEATRSGPPTRPLNVPSVPELLRLRQKERIQNTISSARAMLSSQRNLAQEEYSLRLGEFQGSSKYVSKMKSKQHIAATEEPAIPLNLPEIQLPITTLPKFDLGFSAVSLASTVPGAIPTFNSVEANISSNIPQTITVARSTVKRPIDASTVYQEVPVFTFRQPLDPQDDDEERAVLDSVYNALSHSLSNTSSSSVLRESSVTGKLRNNSQHCELDREREVQSRTSTGLLDLGSERQKLKRSQVELSESDKQTSEKWQCKSCAVNNSINSDKCVCGLLRGSTLTTESTGFGAQFKLSEDMWECSTCMVRNKTSDTSCVACTSARPATKPAASHDPQTCIMSSFGDKFKPPASSWECSMCLVRNPESLNRCQACTAEKPHAKERNNQLTAGSPFSSSVDQLKKSEGSWYCTVCMVCNKPGTRKCSACDYVNPNSSQSGIQFKFDIPAEASNFKFGVDKAGNNSAKTITTSAGSFSFGGSTKNTAVATTFSFGIPTTATSNSNPQLSNAISVEVPSGGKANAALSLAVQKKSEYQNASKKNSGTPKRRLSDAQDVVDDSSQVITSGDKSEGRVDTKKVSFCFEPMKGFGTSSDNILNPSPVVSSSVGARSSPTPASSPFSLAGNHSVSPKSSIATPTNYNFSPDGVSGKSIPVLVKTSSDTLVSSSLAITKSNKVNAVVTPDTSKTPSVKTSPSGVTAFAKELSSNSESQKKLNAMSKQTTDSGSWHSSAASEANFAGSFPKLAGVFGSSPINTALDATKIAVFGTPVSVAASAASNVNSPIITVTQSSSNVGSAFGTSSSASYSENSSTPVFGSPSAVTQAFGLAKNTATTSLVFPAATSVSSVFGVTTTATPVFGATTTTTTTAATQMFRTTTTNATPAFGASGVTTAAGAPMFGVVTAAPVFGATTITTTPLFGAAATTTTTTATPMFGAVTTSSAPAFGTASIAAAPVFGVASTTAAPTFGATTTTAPPVFGVTSSTTAIPIFGTTATTASSVFGGTSTSTAPVFRANTTTSSVGFGVATTVAPSAFGVATTTSSSLFGSSAGSSVAVFGSTNTPPSFGATAQSSGFGAAGTNFSSGSAAAQTFGAAVPSGFGSTTTNEAAFGSSSTSTQSFQGSAAPQVFGSVGNDSKSSLDQSTDKSVAPFAFGANNSGQAAQSQPFQFAGNQTNALNKPDFNFGSANVSGPQRPGFGFGSSAQQQQSSPFSFGSNAAVPTTHASLFSAGASAAAPAAAAPFGTAQVSGNFGGANSSTGFASGTFNFGQSSTNVFGFSGTEAPVSSASTSSPAQPFQFGQSATPAVQFDPNAKPTFNFTGGETPVFTASPAGGATATQPRRIKKAMRRTHR